MKNSRALSWLQLEWRWLVVSIAVAHFVLGTVYSLATPIWEGPDELGHYNHVKFVVDNLSLPGPGDVTTHLEELTHPPLYYILAAVATSWVDSSDDLQPVENPYTYSGIMQGGVNRFIHPDTEAFPYQGTVLTVHLLRLVSVFISTLVVIMSYLLGRLLFPAQEHIALGAMAFNAFSPGVLYMGSVVNNDILVTLFFTLALFFSAKVIIRSPNLADLFVLGSFTGLALLSKYNALALVPLVIISAGFAVARRLRSRRSLAMSLGGAILLLLGVALVYSWWVVRSVALFGTPAPRVARIVTQLLKDIRDPLAGIERVDWAVLPAALRYYYASFWAYFGWGNIDAEAWVYQILGLICLAGISGFILFMLGKASLPVKGGALILLLSFVFISGLAIYRTLAIGDPVLRGRYALPSISAVSVLLSLGIVRLTPRRLTGIPIFLASLTLFVLGLVAPFRYILPAYAKPPVLSPEEAVGIPNPLGIDFGNRIELLGYELGTRKVTTGDLVPITLYWRCLAEVDENYTVGLAILGPDDEAYGQIAAYPGHGNYATSLWKEGEIIEDSYQVRVRHRFPAPGVARIYLALYTYPEEEHLLLMDSQGEPTDRAAIFGRLGVAPAHPRAYDVAEPLYYSLEDQMELVGYEILGGGTFNIGCLRLALYWQAAADMVDDYTVLVHLVAQQGEIVAQDDSQPRRGYYATSFWSEGEVIEDEHTLCFPRNLQPGNYDLVTGAYRLESMQRLSIRNQEGDSLPGDQIILVELELQAPNHRSFAPLVFE